MNKTNKNEQEEALSHLSPVVDRYTNQEIGSKYENLSKYYGSWIPVAKRVGKLQIKKQVSLRIDEDILDFFRQQGGRYQTKMHAVLRVYVDSIKNNKNEE